jgi:hypothetical protein
MSKLILFVGATIAMGFVWLLCVVLAADLLFSQKLEGSYLAWAAGCCFVVAMFPSWKLFVIGTKRGP